jgi:methylglutaconyl-CoA hydratase
MTPADAPLVRASTGRGVATLMLDSPHNRNALSTPLMAQLLEALRAAVADPAVRAIVLSHAGPVFCAGADLKETAAAYETERPTASPASSTVDRVRRDQNVPAAMLGDVLAAIWECPKPVVARVAGPARAGGLGLIAAADIAICAEDATFAFSEVRLGVIPAVISSTVLRRLTPRAAAELYLTGEVFDGRRAAQIGLASRATPADALDETVAAYCDALVRGAPGALAGAKELLRRPPAATLRDEVAALSELSVGYFLSEEGREGVLAYRERRAAAWVPRD